MFCLRCDTVPVPCPSWRNVSECFSESVVFETQRAVHINKRRGHRSLQNRETQRAISINLRYRGIRALREQTQKVLREHDAERLRIHVTVLSAPRVPEYIRTSRRLGSIELIKEPECLTRPRPADRLRQPTGSDSVPSERSVNVSRPPPPSHLKYLQHIALYNPRMMLNLPISFWLRRLWRRLRQGGGVGWGVGGGTDQAQTGGLCQLTGVVSNGPVSVRWMFTVCIYREDVDMWTLARWDMRQRGWTG